MQKFPCVVRSAANQLGFSHPSVWREYDMNPFKIYLWCVARLSQVTPPRPACSFILPNIVLDSRLPFANIVVNVTHRLYCLGSFHWPCTGPSRCASSHTYILHGHLDFAQAVAPRSGRAGWCAASKATRGLWISARERWHCSDLCESFHFCFTRIHAIA